MRFGPSLLSLEPYLTQAKDKEKTKSSLYYLAFKQISQGLASKFFFKWYMNLHMSRSRE